MKHVYFAFTRAFEPLAALGAAVVFACTVTGCDSSSPTPPIVIVPLSSVVVAPESDTLRVGTDRSFVALAYDTLGVLVNDVNFSWESENPSVFTVNATGRVHAEAEGVARLFVESNSQRDTAVVFVYPDTGWVLQPNPSSGSNLNGVYFRQDGQLGWAVGDGGRIMRTTNAGADWVNASATGTSFSLQGVWFTSDLEGWAVGSGSTVLKSVDGGDNWTRVMSANPGENLLDVVFVSATRGFAVGANGTLIRTTDRGVTWDETNLPTAFALNAVSFGSDSTGWAVGNGGLIAFTTDRGDSWDVLSPFVTSSALNGVSTLGPFMAYAAGFGGVTTRTTVTGPDSWELGPNVGASNLIEGLHFPTSLIGYAVGFNSGGIVLRTEDGGQNWFPQVSRTTSQLNDVWFVDALRGWAVGEGGVIIHTASGGRAF
ncbi:MAG: hypothetical protein HOP12_09940 [Candidatus Eisenbacteria bacterium]|uniref:Photosynthesis system II assembly factor Ycf48/Hcf136-like domain-containing protein n=1 Tax=Eiseniibacteriota bacterium TaxID=2212470 RepID=A0A849SNP5_UNCEI|nr:hypothetical protein [Candidatus Eisenbacteria bacterium]